MRFLRGLALIREIVRSVRERRGSDVIVAIDGQPVETTRTAAERLAAVAAGERVMLSIRRDGIAMEIAITVVEPDQLLLELEHEKAKAELKGLMPEDAKEAIGHGIRAKRSKTGAVSFELLNAEGAHHAPLQ